MNTENKSVQQHKPTLKEMFNKRKTKLLEFSMPTEAIIRLVPILRQLSIPYDLEKQLKSDLIVLEVDQRNSKEIFWVSTICELIRDCFTKYYGFYFLTEPKVEAAVRNVQIARR